MTVIKENIIQEAKRIDEDSKYSSIAHFKASSRWNAIHLWIGIPTAILSAISGTITLTDSGSYLTLAGLIAILVAALSTISTFLNPNEKTNIHHEAGTNYNTLRNKARIFTDIDCTSEKPTEELQENLTKLANTRDELNRGSPHIPEWAYNAAKKSILDGETDYLVDSK